MASHPGDEMGPVMALQLHWRQDHGVSVVEERFRVVAAQGKAS